MIIKLFLTALLISVVISALTGHHIHNLGKKFLGIFYNYPKGGK